MAVLPDRCVTFKASETGDRFLASVTGSVGQVLEALTSLDAGRARAALVFASGPSALERAGKELATLAPDAAVAGCTSAGLVDRYGQVDAELQVTLFGGTGFVGAVRRGDIGVGSIRDAGATAGGACDALDGVAGDHTDKVLVLLVDGLTGDTNQIVRGAYDAVGAGVPIVGGCAGDDLAMETTHQLCGNEVLTGGAVGLALASTGSFGLGVRHGWHPIGSAMTVTSASRTSVLGLDDQPALDVYLDAIGFSGADLTPAGLARACQTRPLGLHTNSGHHVRFVRGGDLDARSIEFLVAIPEGELVSVMAGDADSVVGASGNAAGQALAELGGPPLGLVGFDCVACRGVIGDDAVADEMRQVTEALPNDAVLAGLYTYGEIARRGGSVGFHNQTMVVLAVQ